ncbi:hypothetical protein B0H11DRAFT_37812 [Mycena galericulata]|nr:hypothetical protein B0H11DRAFT_37812 [Mycena galericulata]
MAPVPEPWDFLIFLSICVRFHLGNGCPCHVDVHSRSLLPVQFYPADRVHPTIHRNSRRPGWKGPDSQRVRVRVLRMLFSRKQRPRTGCRALDITEKGGSLTPSSSRLDRHHLLVRAGAS